MEKLTLRPYQAELLKEALRPVSEHGWRKVMIYGPQGCGKSVLIAFMAQNSVKKGNRVLILSHRDKIVQQNFDKMLLRGMNVSIVNRKSTKLIDDANCYCGMSQTISRRISSLPAWKEWLQSMDFVIVDEAHRGEHDLILDNLRDNVFLFGLSATVNRTGTMKQMGFYYDCIVKTVECSDLIPLKYLTPSRNFTFQAPKLADVSVSYQTGDYSQKELHKKFAKAERYAGIIENYQRLTPGTKAIVFTTGTKHCVDLCIAFNNAGLRSKYLVSTKLPETDALYSGKQEDVLNDFYCGVFDVLVNISILDTGFDDPSIETVILDFSTKSYNKYAQCVGRPSRPMPQKECFNVLDFGSNVEAFGRYERRNPPMSLWHLAGGGGVAPSKDCPKCSRLIPVVAKTCPYCGYVFPTEKDIYLVELQELVNDLDVGGELSLKAYVAQKKLQGWKNDWILRDICIKNQNNMKKAFLDAIEVLRTETGANISPQYWHFFKSHKLKNIKKNG